MLLQAPGSYGIVPYRLPPNQPPFHNMVPALNQGNGMRPGRPNPAPGAQRSYGLSSPSYVGSGYPSVQSFQHPTSFSGRMMNQRPLHGFHGPVPSAAPNSPLGASPDVSSSSKSQLEGHYKLHLPALFFGVRLRCCVCYFCMFML